jgi:hypothetical protein
VLNIRVFLSFNECLYIYGGTVGCNCANIVGPSYLCDCERLGLEEEREKEVAFD